MARRYLIFTIVGSALMMVSIDMTIVAVALPTILDELNTSLALASWTLTGSQLTQTIVLSLAGKLGDRWGRKRLLLASVVLFTLGSIGAGFSPSIYPLIVCRVVQAVGGGMFFPCAAGIVGDVFGDARQTAIGLFVTIFQIGGVIGPNIGGIITDQLSWRGIFFVNAPVGLAILLLGLAYIPRDKPADAADRQRLDTAGAGLFAGAMFSLLFGLTYLANHPESTGDPTPWACMAGGAFLMALFLRHESRTAEPIIDLRLARWRPFLACNCQLFMWSSAFNGFFNFIPYYAAVAYGMSATQGGAILTPRSLVAVVVSLISSVFVARIGYRRPWLIGIYLMASAMMLTSIGVQEVDFLGLTLTPFLLLSLFTCIAGLAIGVAIPPSQNAYFDLRPDLMATSAGFRAMAGNSGGVFGTAMVTLALSHFDDKAQGVEVIFFALGCLVLLSQVFVFMVPDKAKAPKALQAVEVTAAG
jgi:EmrB/QacA subfamily drug resistance transporter